MEGSGLEFILRISNNGAPIAENQNAVATLAQVGMPFTMKIASLGEFLNSADELVPSHGFSVSDIFVRLSKRATTAKEYSHSPV